ncbi:hypothetical protein ACFO3N_04705, partial [Flavobacterium chungangensis]
VYRYTNEAGDTVDIEVINDVTSNFTTIVADPDVKRILEELIKVTGGNVSYNADTQKFYYKDANGDDQEISINDAIAKADLTTTTSDTVLKVTGTKATLVAATVDLVPSVNKGDVLTTTAAGVEWKAPQNNKMNIRRITANGQLDETSDSIIVIDGSATSGTINLNLPGSITDDSMIGKVFSIKRADANDNATVKIVATGGTIDETDTTITLGLTNTVQIVIESIAPLKWQVLSKF